MSPYIANQSTHERLTPFNHSLATDLTLPSVNCEPDRRDKGFTASQTAFYVHQIGNELADKLEQAAHDLLFIEANERDAAEALAKADCIRETESKENIFYSINQTSKSGDKFNAYGSLSVAFSSCLSPSAEAKKSQRRARDLFKKYIKAGICDVDRKLITRADGSLKAFPRGVRHRTIVLTSPELECDEETSLLIHQEAIKLLKKRDIIAKNVVAGHFNVELTSGKGDLPRAYWHSHGSVFSKWFNINQLANDLTDCYEKAAAGFGVEFILPTSCTANRLNVWIEDTATNAKENGKSFEKAVFESCKYISKGVDLANFSPDQLIRIEKAIADKHLLVSFGEFNNHRGSASRKGQRTVTNKTLVHKGTQLTAKRPSTFIQKGTQMILDGKRDQWLLELKKREESRRAFRRFQLAKDNPTAVFFTLDGQRFSSSDFLEPKKPNVRSWLSIPIAKSRAQIVH